MADAGASLAKKKMKILFANFPGEGHFNPLTGLAAHLKRQGHDVRWYTSKIYADKLRRLQIARLKFDMINAFILRGPEYYADILEIYKTFRFDLLVADCAFTGIPFVKELIKVPVVSVGLFPLTETSRDLPPAGLGMTPSQSFIGRVRQSLLRGIARRVIFGEPHRVMYQLLDQYKIPHQRESLFDMIIRKSDLLLQIGTPGFEYYRSDLGENIRFVVALLPHDGAKEGPRWFDAGAYVTNGGYGGTMLGINLGVERPTSLQVRQAVEKVFSDDVYRRKVKELALEFSKYDAYERCSRHISSVVKKASINSSKVTDNSYVIPFSS